MYVVKFLEACEYKLSNSYLGREIEMAQNNMQMRSRLAIGEGGIQIFFFLKTILFSYILTAALLLVLAFLLYKMELSEGPVAVAIIVIYVIATFFAGFMTGKKMQSRKFLWGLLMGVAYFVVLALVSLAVKQSPETLGNSFFTTLVLCAGGGMLGGMLS